MLLGLGCIFFTALKIWRSLPSQEEIEQMSLVEPIKVFTRDHLLIGEIGALKRYPKNSDQIPSLLKKAFLCIEDKRFYEHSGVDLKALLRASIAVAVKRKKVQGGSTITMQVARNFYLGREKTYFRKFKEILLALKIESLLSKEKILELYLNKIFLGHHSYGIEAASRTYFGQGIKDLSLSQVAILASLPKAPSLYNPLSSPEKCLKRRNTVLQKLFQDKIISDKEREEALKEPIVSKYFPRKIELPLPKITDLIKEKINSHDINVQNFKVVTTIDSQIQRQAQQALDQGLESYDRRHSYQGPLKFSEFMSRYEHKDFSQSPLIPVQITQILSETEVKVRSLLKDSENLEQWTLDSQALKYIRLRKENSNELLPFEKTFEKFSLGDCLFLTKKEQFITQIPRVSGAIVTLNNKGEILAFVSGLSYGDSQLITPIQTKRQVGSTFKPFIYALGFDQGYTMDSLLQDSPHVFKDNNGKKWSPQNADKKYLGSITLEQAFVQSRNLATLSLGTQLPMRTLYKTLSQFLEKPLKTDVSTLLGTIELSALELCELYLSFINDGKIKKSSLLPMSPEKKEQEENNYVSFRLFSDKAAYLTKYLMKKSLHKKKDVLSLSSGGKTGTTNEYQDLWFAGFSQDLCSVVWMGFEKPAPLYEFASKNTTLIWKQALGGIQRDHEENIPSGIGFKRDQNSNLFIPNLQKERDLS